MLTSLVTFKLLLGFARRPSGSGVLALGLVFSRPRPTHVLRLGLHCYGSRFVGNGESCHCLPHAVVDGGLELCGIPWGSCTDELVVFADAAGPTVLESRGDFLGCFFVCFGNSFSDKGFEILRVLQFLRFVRFFDCLTAVLCCEDVLGVLG